MLILTIRTDNPEAKIGLFENDEQLAYKTWLAHRQLSETIHSTINTLLQSVNKKISDLNGIIYFEGPGSFTGLRIGAAVANALSKSLNIPVASVGGVDWIKEGMLQISTNETKIAMPNYGSDPKVTKQKK